MAARMVLARYRNGRKKVEPNNGVGIQFQLTAGGQEIEGGGVGREIVRRGVGRKESEEVDEIHKGKRKKYLTLDFTLLFYSVGPRVQPPPFSSSHQRPALLPPMPLTPPPCRNHPVVTTTVIQVKCVRMY